MTSDVDLDKSLRGLWLGSGYGSYLTTFFPRLDIGRPHLVPLQPGMNVLYGRNGAGKTQMLNALAAASNWEMGPMEGFILDNPSWDRSAVDEESGVTYGDLTAEEILAGVSVSESPAVDLGWTWGYDATLIRGTHRDLVLAMLAEFQRGGLLMLTRGLHPYNLWGVETPLRRYIVPPRVTELVPVLLPNQEAPLTRAHMEEMRASLQRVLDEAVNPLGYFRHDEGEDDFTYANGEGYNWRDLWAEGPVEDALTEGYRRWRKEWGWSPLANARNLGHLGGSLDCHGLEYRTFSVHSPSAALFLPPLVVEARQAESDFVSGTADPIFKPYQEEAQSSVDINRLEYRPWSKKDEPSEELTEKASVFFQKEIDTLKQRLAFLPGLSSALHFTLDYDSRNTATLNIGATVRADRGSRAEVRWLEFARTAWGKWLFFDEPEAGVHRTAEADLALCLNSDAWLRTKQPGTYLSSDHGRTIVVATHSPEFLGLANANLLHVDGGQARQLGPVDRASLALLGLRPSDLLSRIKTFLLVEGEHERIVFESLFSEELNQLRVGLVVARGGKNMKDIFDSQVLFDFSDARIVALLDNMDAGRVHSLWNRARDLAATGQVDEAGALVRSELPRHGSGENRFLSQFLTRALEGGEHERVGAWGLHKEDIVLYLPPEAFGIRRTWEDALSTFDASAGVSLKPWLGKKYGADFSLANVRKAAESLDQIPEDFTGLLTFLSS